MAEQVEQRRQPPGRPRTVTLRVEDARALWTWAARWARDDRPRGRGEAAFGTLNRVEEAVWGHGAGDDA